LTRRWLGGVILPMRIALVSSANVWAGEADDVPLHDELRRLGAVVSNPAWDDPSMDWGDFDLCLLRTTWDYHERREEFLRWARRVSQVTQLHNPLAVIEWNSVKTYLQDLESVGLPIAPTLWLCRGEEVDLGGLLSDRGWRRGFLKPEVGACASQTLPFNMDAQGIAVAQAHLDEELAGAGFLVQPFLESVGSEGEYSVIFIDGELTHCVRKVPVPGDYRVMDEYGASDSLVTLDQHDLSLARRVYEACERRFEGGRGLLYCRVDFLRDGDGALVINEVELVEPSLFFRHCEPAAVRFAERLVDRARPAV